MAHGPEYAFMVDVLIASGKVTGTPRGNVLVGVNQEQARFLHEILGEPSKEERGMSSAAERHTERPVRWILGRAVAELDYTIIDRHNLLLTSGAIDEVQDAIAETIYIGREGEPVSEIDEAAGEQIGAVRQEVAELFEAAAFVVLRAAAAED